MRRRTKRIDGRRPMIYLAIIVIVVAGEYIYSHFVPENVRDAAVAENVATDSDSVLQKALSLDKAVAENVTTEGDSMVESAPSEEKNAAVDNGSDVVHTASGWAEAVAERDDKDLYYTKHFCAVSDAVADAEGSGADKNRAVKAIRNYTVCYSRARRCPLWVAAPLHTCYRGSAKRSGSFRFDPTLPTNIQPQLSRSYGSFTRGHLLGSAERTLSAEANRQTFYASNIAPQMGEGFNAANGAWNNVEIFVDRQVCADTLYVVTGCIFDDYTDATGRKTGRSVTVNKNDNENVSVPTAYYKALLRTRSGSSGRSVGECDEAELKCVALVVGHFGQSGRKPRAADMMSVAELERLTGERFFVNVPQAPKSSFAASDWGVK